MPSVKSFQRIVIIILIGSISLIPVLFLPVSEDYFDTYKLTILWGASGFFFLMWSLVTLSYGSVIRLNVSGISLSLAALTVSGLVSLLFASTNKVEGILAPLGIATLLPSTVIVIMGGSLIGFLKKYIPIMFGVSGGLMAILGIYTALGIGSTFFPDAPLLRDSTFSPTGSSLSQFIIILVILPVIINEIIVSHRKSDEAAVSVASIIALLMFGGLTVTGITAINTYMTQVLPLGASWSIVLESLKQMPAGIIGVGAEKYISAFTLGRPSSLNIGELWNSRFTLAGSSLLHVMTVYGIPGVISAVLMLRSYLFPPKDTPLLIRISLFLSALFFCLTPYSLSFFIVMILLALLVYTKDSFMTTIRIPARFRIVGYILPVVATISLMIICYGSYRYLIAEQRYHKAMVAYNKGQASNSYDLLKSAISLNPYMTQYHIILSQVSLIMADAITTSKGAANEPLPQDTRTLATELIKEGVEYAKKATQLAPDNILAYDALAQTYTNIINVAGGAEEQAQLVVRKQIALDPSNPVHRVNMATLLLRKNEYDAARSFLESAILLKRDSVSAYYTLATIFRKLKKPLEEAQTLKIALNFVTKDSSDAEQMKTAYENAYSQLTSQQQAILDASNK